MSLQSHKYCMRMRLSVKTRAGKTLGTFDYLLTNSKRENLS